MINVQIINLPLYLCLPLSHIHGVLFLRMFSILKAFILNIVDHECTQEEWLQIFKYSRVDFQSIYFAFYKYIYVC